MFPSMHRLLIAVVLLLTICDCNASRSPSLLLYEHGMLLPPYADEQDELPEQWFPQQLDHFDPQNTITWQQRYFVNDSYWTDKAKGPVFLKLGGESSASSWWVSANTDMMRNAKKYGALALLIEHRYLIM